MKIYKKNFVLLTFKTNKSTSSQLICDKKHTNKNRRVKKLEFEMQGSVTSFMNNPQGAQGLSINF